MGDTWRHTDWPVGTRLFAQVSPPYGYWTFGPSTREQPGDYYRETAPAVPSIYTLEAILCRRDAHEVCIFDPDMLVDEGL